MTIDDQGRVAYEAWLGQIERYDDTGDDGLTWENKTSDGRQVWIDVACAVGRLHNAADQRAAVIAAAVDYCLAWDHMWPLEDLDEARERLRAAVAEMQAAERAAESEER